MGNLFAAPLEIRLALVLNGGVSLAVWMGGVTHELDLLRRASRGDREESVPEEDRPVFGMWKRYAERANYKVLIDVIAGTSAGGVNGTLLAAAIGRGSQLPDLRATWLKSAALTCDKLLGESPHSLLDGEYFERAIGAEFAKMEDVNDSAEPVTLFVTATALDGAPCKYADGFKGKFDVADHRRLYRFHHDPFEVTYVKGEGDGSWRLKTDSRNDFDDGLGALRLAARASAGFPLAFSPVDEADLLRYRTRPAHRLDPPDEASCVIDGGILNNAPFEPVLEAIADRTVNGRLKRVVVYIVPSSGQEPQQDTDRAPCSDVPLTTIASTSVNYPRESNLRTGTEALSARLSSHTEDLHHQLFMNQRDSPTQVGGPLQTAAGLIFGEYRVRRAGAAVWKARQLMAGATWRRSLKPTPQGKGEEILEGNPLWVPVDPPTLDQPLAANFEEWSWGVSPAERLVWTLTAHLQDRLRYVGDTDAQTSLTSAIQNLSGNARVIRSIEEALDTQIRNSQRGLPSGFVPDDRWVTQRFNELFQELGVRSEVGEQVRQAVEFYLNALPAEGRPSATQVLKECLCAEVLTKAFAPPPQLFDHTPDFHFLRLGPDAASPVFPQGPIAQLTERKLYGIRLNHFGAFVHADWRASDFTWGRLDATHHLLRLLIEDETRQQEAEAEIHEAILDREIGKEQMLKNLQELTLKDSELFNRFLKSDNDDTAANVTKSVLRLLRGWSRSLFLWHALAQDDDIDESARKTILRRLTGSLRDTWWRRVRENPKAALKESIQALKTTALKIAALLLGAAIALGVVATIIVGLVIHFFGVTAGLLAVTVLVLGLGGAGVAAYVKATAPRP